MTEQHVNRQNIGVKTDRFDILGFDHLEFWSNDAKSTMKALKVGCGMKTIATSMHETGNHIYASYVLTTGNIKWISTSPYNSEFVHPEQKCPHPKFDSKFVTSWVEKHGSGVAVIGVKVGDAHRAYDLSTGKGESDPENWAKGYLPPTEIKADNGTSVVISEIFVYGDTLVRFIERRGFEGPFLPGYKEFDDVFPLDYGLKRMDHVVGNVHDLNDVIGKMAKWFGFHIFAHFTKEDIQTEYTSLNSYVMANNDETVLLPINEPAKKKRESQITEFLKAYNGAGVQHIAILTPDIQSSIALMSQSSGLGGFEFIPTPDEYYNDEIVKKIMVETLTPEAQSVIKKYGILVDRDDEGVLLQIFTKPLFDRPTIFVEIIQRICKGQIVDKAGCGGFGKGNFRALFESIERLQAARGMLLEEK